MANNELLWAVAQQLSGLDGGDALLIETIQNGPPPKQLVEQFLQGYNLWRFGGFAKRPRSLDVFADVAERRFRPRPANISAANQTWLDAVKEFKGRSHLDLHSAFSKFYWFYQPRMLPLYDTYARKGLPKAEKRLGIRPQGPVKPENFFDRFEAVHVRLAHDIREAIGMFGRRCPYERRVLDKYLWLLGDRPDQQERLLRAFAASLRLAPLLRSARK